VKNVLLLTLPATAAETEAAVHKSPAQRDMTPEIRREIDIIDK